MSSSKWVVISAFSLPILVSWLYFSIQKKRKPLKRISSKDPSFCLMRDFTRTALNSDSQSLSTQGLITLGLEQPMVIAMVGLPARGKSYLVNMIMRYLKWTGFECQVFNVGSYRRKMGYASATADFFDSSNPNSKRMREEMAQAVQDDMYKWLHEVKDAKRRVAIFDATNTTKSRRMYLAERARSEKVFLLFVESICDDEQILRRNYEMKLKNDDYKNIDPETALKDFMSRVKEYEKVYETVEDNEDNTNISYIKLINVGQKLITRNCNGYLPSQVAFYLQNCHIEPRKIYLSIIAESVEQTEYISGSESGELSERGSKYSIQLAKFIQYEQKHVLQGQAREIVLLTGTSTIHCHTVAPLTELDVKCYNTPLLNELRGGDFHGMSKQEIKDSFPTEYEKRVKDKLNYRYPGIGGESYMDVIERIKPIVIELERQRRSVIVVCHVAVLRCIYGYFMGVPQEEIPMMEFQKHHIYELQPGSGCTCKRIDPNEL